MLEDTNSLDAAQLLVEFDYPKTIFRTLVTVQTSETAWRTVYSHVVVQASLIRSMKKVQAINL